MFERSYKYMNPSIEDEAVWVSEYVDNPGWFCVNIECDGKRWMGSGSLGDCMAHAYERCLVAKLDSFDVQRIGERIDRIRIETSEDIYPNLRGRI